MAPTNIVAMNSITVSYNVTTSAPTEVQQLSVNLEASRSPIALWVNGGYRGLCNNTYVDANGQLQSNAHREAVPVFDVQSRGWHTNHD